MSVHHGEIVRDLGDGWALAWDTTEVDPETRQTFAEVLAEHTRELFSLVEEISDGAATDVPQRPLAANLTSN